jgi:hypothetical protein
MYSTTGNYKSTCGNYDQSSTCYISIVHDWIKCHPEVKFEYYIHRSRPQTHEIIIKYRNMTYGGKSTNKNNAYGQLWRHLTNFY